MSGILRLSNDATGQSTLDTNATADVIYSLPDTGSDSAAIILTDDAHEVTSINWDGIAVNIQNGDINLDNGTLFVDESTNRVGIGTTSPAYKLNVTGGGIGINPTGGTAVIELNVDGTATFTDQILVDYADFTSGNETYVLNEGSNSTVNYELGLYTTSNGTPGTFYNKTGNAPFLYKVGGVSRLAITNNGSVRIGGAVEEEGLPAPNISLNAADGSATFDDSVFVRGPLSVPNNTNVNRAEMTSNGYFRVQRTNSNNTFIEGFLDSSQNYRITAGGNAFFRGDIDASNVTFNLEADNDANYVTTTSVDEEGNTVENRVYNGPTLDVKDRLTKTQEALTALKAAAEDNATDLAGLKAAMVAALANS